MHDYENQQQPSVVVAVQWASRVMTISIEMVVPSLIGHWLDQRWGTSYLALVGIVMGMTIAIRHLMSLQPELQNGVSDGGTRPADSSDGSSAPEGSDV